MQNRDLLEVAFAGLSRHLGEHDLTANCVRTQLLAFEHLEETELIVTVVQTRLLAVWTL